MEQLSRRKALSGIAALSALAIGSTAKAQPTPTDQELTRYYAFLWFELRLLSQELGVDLHDCHTIIRNDDQKALKEWQVNTLPPSTRAKAALEAAGLDLRRVPSNPRFPKDPAEYEAMLDRIWADEPSHKPAKA